MHLGADGASDMDQLLPVSEEDDAGAGDIPGGTLYPTPSGGILTASFSHVLLR